MTGHQIKTDPRVAVVTGGNSGIGKAIATTLAKQGWQTVICGRRQNENERVANKIKETFGVESIAIKADVAKEDNCINLINAPINKWGRIDLLVNNAGISGGGKIADSSTEVFERILRTNLYSTYWCSREAYKRMLCQPVSHNTGLRGAIINVSSICGVDAWAGSGIYCTSKHGVMALTKAMADEGSADLIRVAAICPAMVASPMTGVNGPEFISTEDIASTVTYLLQLSPAAWPTEIIVKRKDAS